MKIGYARVTTIDRSPARQLDALKLAGCKRTFEETTSGARGDRPQLKAALSHLRKGDTLVVWKLDRLARSLGQLIRTINDLDRRGIGFIALTNQIDTTTAHGRLTFHLIGALAEFERAIISERAKTSMKAAKARGAKNRAAAHDDDGQNQNGKEARPARFDTDSYRAADWSVCFNALSLFTGDVDKSCASAEAQALGTTEAPLALPQVESCPAGRS